MAVALDIQDLVKTYDNNFTALQGVSLTVEQGDFYALLGPNGAGKSTTIGILCSLIQKTSGRVEIFGNNIDTNFAGAKRQIGIVPQEFNFNAWEKVFHIVVNQGGYYGLPRKLAEQRAEKYLRQLGLWDKRDQASRTLSGGMKRRLMIARALVHEPRLLILDEPTAGVDIELRRSMWAFLRDINAQGTTIILTTHYLEEAESLCRNVGIISNGKLIRATSMKSLLRELDKETLIFDLAQTLDNAPDIPGYQTRLQDSSALEVDITKGKSLNQLVAQLTEAGIEILSMRNKTNRLEELFVEMVSSEGEQ